MDYQMLLICFNHDKIRNSIFKKVNNLPREINNTRKENLIFNFL